MNKIIKQLSRVLLGGAVALSFASCNDHFDETSNAYTYPTGVSLGKWAIENPKSGENVYTVNITLNEKGDTICDVTYYNPTTELSNVLSGGKVSYNPATGMITADYEDAFYGTPARVMMAYKNGSQDLIAYVYQVNKSGDSEVLSRQDYANLTPCDTISVFGTWEMTDGQLISINTDGTANVTSAEGETVSGTYTKSGTTTTVTANGKVYTMQMNDKGQTYTTVNGTSLYTAHTATQYIDDWSEVATGTYYCDLFEHEVEGVSMEYSKCRKEYRLDMAYYFRMLGLSPQSEDNYLSFYWSKEAGTFSIKSGSVFYTGYNYQGYGIVQGEDGGGSSYDAKTGVFNFNINYNIPGIGSFGVLSDTFTPDAE